MVPPLTSSSTRRRRLKTKPNKHISTNGSSRNNKPRWDFVGWIVFVVFGLIVVNRFDDLLQQHHDSVNGSTSTQSHHFSTEEEQVHHHRHHRSKLEEKCQLSCRATLSTSSNGYMSTILQHHNDPTNTINSSNSDASPTSLSSSAVSAMLNLWEGQQQIDVNEYGSIRKEHSDMLLENIGITTATAITTSINGDELLQKFARPQRLPPLIDVLVGTLDSDMDHLNGHSTTKRKRKLIRKVNVSNDSSTKAKQGDGSSHRSSSSNNDNDTNNYNNEEIYHTTQGLLLKDMDMSSLGEDPVAMVAAAAAASLWSERNYKMNDSSLQRKDSTRTSPLRMKVINDEWEEALRWISSWGTTTTTMSTTTTSTTTTSTTNVQSNTATSTHHPEGITEIENNKGDDDVNVQKQQEQQRKHHRRKHTNSNDRTKTSMNFRFSDENEIDFERVYEVCIDRCLGLGDDGVNGSVPRSHNKMGESSDIVNVESSSSSGINRLFSLLMSNTMVNGSQKSILKEEQRTYVKTVWGLFGIILSTVGVWVRNLLDRRKQSSCYHSLLEEEDARELANTTSTFHSSNKHRNNSGNNINGGGSSNNNNNRKTGSKKKSRRKRRDNRSNHQKQHRFDFTTSRSDEESVSSDVSVERSEDVLFFQSFGDQGSKEGNATISTLTADEVEFEEQLDSNDLSHSPNKARMKPKTAAAAAHSAKNDRRNEISSPRKYHVRGKGSGGVRYSNNHSNKMSKSVRSTQMDYALSDKKKRYSLQSLMVAPTPAQREEAARKLKLFQQTQIQKMVNLSRSKVLLEKEVHNDPTGPVSSSLEGNQITPDSNCEGVKHVPPPPGLTRVTNIEHQKHYDEFIQEENDPSLLVSHLLDEDDERIPSPYLGLAGERNNSLQGSHIQPIPFGDLLVGTYSTKNVSNNNGASISNPWRDEAMDCSTVTTQGSTPSHTSMHNASSLASISSEIVSSKDANFCLQVSAQAFSPTVKSNGIEEAQAEEQTKIW